MNNQVRHEFYVMINQTKAVKNFQKSKNTCGCGAKEFWDAVFLENWVNKLLGTKRTNQILDLFICKAAGLIF